MANNSFGHLFTVTTFGESHGFGVGAIIDGCPPGIKLTEKDFQKELDRRKPNSKSIASTSRKEEDQVQIISGIFENKTIGTPIALLVKNKDQHSKDYKQIKECFRPGHADYSYFLKYGHYDYRGGGRSSGRETIGRVLGGTIAKQILPKSTKIIGYIKQLGAYKFDQVNYNQINKNPYFIPSKKEIPKIESFLNNLKKEKESCGGIIEIVIKNPPIGLGNPVFDKLEADIGKALLSIGGVKGIEFGEGFEVATKKGSENNDQIGIKDKKVIFNSNYSGGVLGGISNGQDLIVRIAIKATASIGTRQETITKKNKKISLELKGRHDACILPRVVPVAESMIAIVLADHYLRQKAIS